MVLVGGKAERVVQCIRTMLELIVEVRLTYHFPLLFVTVVLYMFLINSLSLSRLPLKDELSSTTLTFTTRPTTMVASVVRMKSGAVGPWEASLRGGVAAEAALIECPPVEVVVATTCRTGETMMT